MNSLFKAERRIPATINLLAIGGSTYYLQSKIAYNLEEQEARLDEIEGTLRGHKMEDLYGKRGRHEKKEK